MNFAKFVKTPLLAASENSAGGELAGRVAGKCPSGTISAKSSILDIWLVPRCTSKICSK